MQLLYYDREESPEPPSVGGREGESEAGSAEGEGAVQCVEVDFPSGYTDPWPDELNEVKTNQ